MKKNICGEADLIKKILVGLPVESLIRFKCVCKSWCDLIETSSFIDLYFKSSYSKFGSFILHAAVDSERFREDAVFMLSSVSSECVSTRSSWCSESFDFLSITTGFNGICGRCDVSGSGGWWWRTKDGFCARCLKSHNYVEEKKKKDDQVSSFLGQVSDNDYYDDRFSKIYSSLCDNDQVVVDNNNNYYCLKGGGGGGVSNYKDQQQQQLVLQLENLGFPSCYQFGKPHMVMIVGSCNGLICLHDSERKDVSLWNPVTRQFRVLPKSITIVASDGDGSVGDVHRFFAFGFDDKTNDYKVVLLSGLRLRPRRIIDGPSVGPMECFCRIQVYSLSTDSWRLLEGINVLPGVPDTSSSGQGQLLYLNGSCFLLAKFLLYYSEEQQCIPPPKDNDRFIISLDLTKENIIPIQLPNHHADEELYLCYLGSKIALFTKRIDCMGTSYWEHFHIWVLNEHCSNNKSNVNNASWTNIDWFPIELGLPGEHNIPRGISNDGVSVLLETGIPGGLSNKKRITLYNLVSKKVLNNSISYDQVLKNLLSCDQVLSNAYPYKPSLVSIIGGNGGISSRVLWK